MSYHFALRDLRTSFVQKQTLYIKVHEQLQSGTTVEVQDMDVEMVTVVSAIEALPVVTVLSPLAVSSKNKPGFRVMLRCFSCQEYASCGWGFYQNAIPLRLW